MSFSATSNEAQPIKKVVMSRGARVFSSDHGDMLGQHGSFFGIKTQPYRGAIQVAFVVRYPGQMQAADFSSPEFLTHAQAFDLPQAGAATAGQSRSP